QRMLEEYGRAGHLDRQIVSSRALYARRAALMTGALSAHMPDGTTWTRPQGGFYVWLTAPDGVDTVALSAAAPARKGASRPRRRLPPRPPPGPRRSGLPPAGSPITSSRGPPAGSARCPGPHGRRGEAPSVTPRKCHPAAAGPNAAPLRGAASRRRDSAARG